MIYSSVREANRWKLKEEGHIKDGTDVDLLHNKLCIVAPKDSDTKGYRNYNIGSKVNINTVETNVPAELHMQEALKVS